MRQSNMSDQRKINTYAHQTCAGRMRLMGACFFIAPVGSRWLAHIIQDARIFILRWSDVFDGRMF
jgi:hypothetical protein